ncbi:MAG: 50S ribosomal protein L22 [Acidobacteria bacterium]|jgi:large subunit ribosomal protein L22|nr:MAG: 50S ribosomal protein L22 [Acidobacteriota bacterium]GIU82126.1 MAG: hypothetical protein KatS3mg006_1190 [Pyrinomonadaceae bacterium]
MKAIARTRYLKGSPRKARLVIDLIRGKSVPQALAILGFTNKRAAGPIEKTLRSAIANATYKAEQENIAIDPADLYISTCYVDMGPTKHRWRIRPAPQGRAYRERRHYCHITIEVSTEKPNTGDGKKVAEKQEEQIISAKTKQEEKQGEGKVTKTRKKKETETRKSSAQASGEQIATEVKPEAEVVASEVSGKEVSRTSKKESKKKTEKAEFSDAEQLQQQTAKDSSVVVEQKLEQESEQKNSASEELKVSEEKEKEKES